MSLALEGILSSPSFSAAHKTSLLISDLASAASVSLLGEQGSFRPPRDWLVDGGRIEGGMVRSTTGRWWQIGGVDGGRMECDVMDG